MPERKVTCGDCGASVTIPDGDWNDFRAPALREWESQHADEIHGRSRCLAISYSSAGSFQ